MLILTAIINDNCNSDNLEEDYEEMDEDNENKVAQNIFSFTAILS